METKTNKATVKTSKVEEKKSDVKVASPVSQVKTAEAKTEVKNTEKKVEAKKPVAKKTAAKKTTKTTAAKTTTKAEKTAAAEKKTNVFIQFGGHEYNAEDVLTKIKETIAAETGKRTFKTLDVYIKPEDNVAYYVVNGKPGSVRL